MHSEARLLERLLFAVRFEGAEPAAVGRLISAYQNTDGGLGHALEPDIRSPESQPLFVAVGLQALHDAGWRDQDLAMRLCLFLEGVSDDSLWRSVDLWALLLSGAAIVAMFRFAVGMLPTLAATSAIGIVLYWAGMIT